MGSFEDMQVSALLVVQGLGHATCLLFLDAGQHIQARQVRYLKVCGYSQVCVDKFLQSPLSAIGKPLLNRQGMKRHMLCLLLFHAKGTRVD